MMKEAKTRRRHIHTPGRLGSPEAVQQFLDLLTAEWKAGRTLAWYRSRVKQLEAVYEREQYYDRLGHRAAPQEVAVGTGE